MTIRFLLSALVALALAAPAAAQSNLAGATLRTTDTGASSIKVGCASNSTTCTGGIRAGQVIIAGNTIIGTDGRIPAISTTYFASLSGANLTGITEASITDSTILARVASDETISGAYTFTAAAGITVSSAGPILGIRETGATANEGNWRHVADLDQYIFQTLSDALGSPATIFSVTRTGTTVDTFTIGAATVLVQAGSSSAPAIASAGNTDLGIYFGANDIKLTANTAQLMSLSASTSSISGGALVLDVSGGSGAAGAGLAVTGPAAYQTMYVLGNSATPLILDRSTSDGTMMDIQRASVSVGSISVAAGVVAYNTFLGSHYTQLMPGQVEPEAGTVVVSTGQQIPSKARRLTKVRLLDAEGRAIGEESIDAGPAPADLGSDRFVYVEPSTRRNQKAVYGIWHADLGRTAAGMSWGDPDAEVYQVAGVGLGPGVWVTDTCGPIANGDWLATSPIEGLAERQCTVGAGGKPGYDAVARDYTLGKALTDVDFSKVQPDAAGVRKVRIPLIITAG